MVTGTGDALSETGNTGMTGMAKATRRSVGIWRGVDYHDGHGDRRRRVGDLTILLPRDRAREAANKTGYELNMRTTQKATTPCWMQSCALTAMARNDRVMAITKCSTNSIGGTRVPAATALPNTHQATKKRKRAQIRGGDFIDNLYRFTCMVSKRVYL